MATPEQMKEFVYAVSDSAKLRALLEQNPDAPTWRDDAGNTALIRAVFVGNRESVKLLLDKCDINAKNAPGMTALHLAVKFGNSDLAGFLLGAGADPDMKDPLGRSPREDVGRNDPDMGAQFNRIAELRQQHLDRQGRDAAVGRLNSTAKKHSLKLKP